MITISQWLILNGYVLVRGCIFGGKSLHLQEIWNPRRKPEPRINFFV